MAPLRGRLFAYNLYTLSCVLPEGPWKSLNDLTRFWAVSYGTVYVLAGTVFDANGDGRADDETLMTRKDDVTLTMLT